jgi:biopolymer transport protein ExbB
MEFLNNTFLQQGGFVMYPLFLVSVFGFFFFVERAIFLHKGQIGMEVFLSGIKNLVRKKRLVEALTLCEDTPGPMARIVKSALLHMGESRESIHAAIQSAAVVELPALERRIGTIAAIARIAPMLGFLGTLVAAVKALYQLEAANADSGEFSLLLAQALITSATGLGIAIMAAMAHHFLTGRVRSLVNDLEWISHSVYEFLTTEAGDLSADDGEVENKGAEG